MTSERLRWKRRSSASRPRRSGPTASHPGSSRKARQRGRQRRRTGSVEGANFHGQDLLLVDACATHTGRFRRAVGDRVARPQGLPGLQAALPQPGLRPRRRPWGPSCPDRSEDDHPAQGPLGRQCLHPRRQPKLERSDQETRSGNCDYLFVLVRDGRRWFIPSTHFGGGTACASAARNTRLRGRAGRSDSGRRVSGPLYNRLLNRPGGCPSGQRNRL